VLRSWHSGAEKSLPISISSSLSIRYNDFKINLFLTLRLLYDDFFGGVTSFRGDHFEKVNGFSNSFFGWGGEDDDLLKRLVQVNVTLRVRVSDRILFRVSGAAADPGFLKGGGWANGGARTNGRIANAQGHRPCWWLPPTVWKGESAAPLNPPLRRRVLPYLEWFCCCTASHLRTWCDCCILNSFIWFVGLLIGSTSTREVMLLRFTFNRGR